jgi:DNA-directed RNA polymerase subunit RPC12/RpoP
MADPPKLVEVECPACGERRFRAERESPEAGDILTCESCGLKLSYGFLQSRKGGASAPPEKGPVKSAARKKKARRKRR